MALYRVRPGFVHGLKNEYKAGDTVELEPRAAAGFADKLELVAVEPEPVTPVAVVNEPVEVAPAIDTPSTFDVTSSTVSAVLAAVDRGEITASEALAIETANRNRSTLVKALTELINGADSE